MVFPHLGSENDSHATKKSPVHNGPKLSDRLLALFVDVILVSPIIQLIISQFVKKIEVLSLTAPDSFEITILILACTVSAIVFLIAYQTVCWTIWGATPGKYFLKIRVISIREEKITWTQAFMRSLIWVFEIALLGIPFLEVLSHYRRRPIHDRAAETTVVTLKTDYDSGPHPIESTFIRQSTIAIISLIGLWGFVGMTKAYRMALDGTFRKDSLLEEDFLCQRISEDSKNRVDEALALFLVGEVSDDCVERESDFQLWSSEAENRAWAFLARGLIAKDRDSISQLYLDKTCADAQKSPTASSQEACYLAGQILGNKANDKSSSTRFESLTAKVLELESLERQGRNQEIIAKVKNFPVDNFEGPLAGYLMRANWGVHGLDKSRGIFEAERLHLPVADRLAVASWMCLQEINLDCEKSLASSSCSEVAKAAPSTQVETAWTQIKLRNCNQSNYPTLKSFSQIFAKRLDFMKLVEAATRENEWPEERRIAELGRVAKESSGVLQSYAIGEWIQLARTQNEFQKAYSILEEQKNHDWKWQANVLNLFRQASKFKEFELGFEVSQLVKPELFQTWGLEKTLLTTAFYANKKEWAGRYWAERSHSRMPASTENSDGQWNEIEKVLTQKSKKSSGDGL